MEPLYQVECLAAWLNKKAILNKEGNSQCHKSHFPKDASPNIQHEILEADLPVSHEDRTWSQSDLLSDVHFLEEFEFSLFPQGPHLWA